MTSIDPNKDAAMQYYRQLLSDGVSRDEAIRLAQQRYNNLRAEQNTQGASPANSDLLTQSLNYQRDRSAVSGVDKVLDSFREALAGIAGFADMVVPQPGWSRADQQNEPRDWAGRVSSALGSSSLTPSQQRAARAAGVGAATGPLFGGGTILGSLAAMAGGAAGGAAGSAIDDAMRASQVPSVVRVPASLAVSAGVGTVGQRGAAALMGSRTPAAAQYMDDVSRFNIPPRAGDVTPPVRAVENVFESVRSGPTLARMRRQAEAVEASIEDVAQRIRPSGMTSSTDRYIANELRNEFARRSARSTELFDAAARAAGNTPIALTNTKEVLARIGSESKVWPGGEIGAQIKKLPWLKTGKLTYRDVRALQRRVGEQLNGVLGGVDYADTKNLYAAIARDLEAIAPGGGLSREALAAHRRAMNNFRDQVAPFYELPAVHEIVRGKMVGTAGQIDLASTNVVNHILGQGRGDPEAARLLLDLLPENGRQAVAYDIFQNAAERGSGFLSVDFSPSAAFRALGVGKPSTTDPSARRLFLDATGHGETADALARVWASTLRSITPIVEPRTGMRASSVFSPDVLLGGAAGYKMGGPVGAPIGALAARAMTTGADRLINSAPFIRYNFAPSSLGGAMSALTGATPNTLLERRYSAR